MFGQKIKLAVIGGLAVAVLAATGCGNSEKSAEKTATGGIPAVIRVGAETTFPPFEFTKDDKYVGFDLDLADAVVKQMGSKMEFKSMGFDALIPAVQSGQIDLIVSGVNATPERAKQVAFSDPYFTESGFNIIVKKDNQDIKDWADLEGKIVGVQVGTQSAKLAQEAKAGTVKQLDSVSQSFLELNAGTIDAIVLDRPVALYYLKQGAEQDLRIVGTTTEGEPFSMAMKKENAELLKEVNKALQTLHENGTYDQIYNKWFGTSATK